MAAVAEATQEAAQAMRPEAEPSAEIFDIYDEYGNYIGQEKRAICHKHGIWHRAVYVFVFNAQQQLLIQKRSMDKKVCPGLWDLSAAEHLSPGESFAQGAVRGLSEEMGITCPIALPPPAQEAAPASSAAHAASQQQQPHDQAVQQEGSAAEHAQAPPQLQLQLQGPLHPGRHQRRLDLPDIGIHDYEFVEAYRLDGYEGQLAFNEQEVSEVAWVGLAELSQRMAADPAAFTPWFRDEAAALGMV